MKKVIAIIFVLFLFTTNVEASSLCSYKEQTELNQKASNVKVSYEIENEVIQFEDKPANTEFFNISILNVTKELYVIVKNNINNEEKKLTFQESNDGIVTFKWDYVDSVTNFTIEVYTTESTSCPHTKVKTSYLTTPRYNEYYDREVCQENSDFYLCQKYVTQEEVNESNFLEKLEGYKKGEINNTGDDLTHEEVTLMDRIFNIINEYKWFILGGTLIIIISIVLIHQKKTKKQRDLGL